MQCLHQWQHWTTFSNFGIFEPSKSLNNRANSKSPTSSSSSSSSSLRILRSNPRNFQFGIQCANGVRPSIINSNLFPELIFWDHMTYSKKRHYEASRFAIDEFHRRQNRDLRRASIVFWEPGTEKMWNYYTILNLKPLMKEVGRRSACNALVRLSV